MSNPIEELNFDVILNDKKFNDTVKSMLNTANKFNSDLSKIMNISTKISTKQVISSTGVANARELLKYLGQIDSKISSMSGKKMLVGDADALNETLQKVLEKMDQFGEKTKKGKDNVQGLNGELNKSQGLLTEMTKLTGIAFGAMGVRNFLSSLVRITGEFEVQKMALTSMLQDANKADAIFNTLRKNALESPYTFQDLTKYAKQLTAFNIDADKLIDTEKRLADVAAGLGVDMGRIILAYGQVKAAGVLKGTELRQFTEAGVPLLQSLADQIYETEGKAISLSEVFQRISKKQIPFEMVEEAFRRMTDEGGKFYNMQEVLVGTLQGKIGKLRDVWQQMLYDMGSSNNILKGSVDFLTKLITHFDTIAKVIAPAVAAWGAYKVAMAAAVSIQNLMLGTQSIMKIINMTSAVKGLEVAMKGVATGAKAASAALGALALVVTGVILLVNWMKKADEATQRLNDATLSYEKALADERKKLGELRAVLQDATQGTDEWNKAKDEVVKTYGKYFDGLDKEITKVGNLETAYANLIAKVEESIAIRKFADYYQGEKSMYESQQDALLKSIQETFDNTKGIDSYQATLWFRELRNSIFAAGNEGRAKEIIDEFNKSHPTVFGHKTKGLAKELDDAYATFMKNTELARERMGFGDRLFDPETLLKRLATTESATVTPTWGPNNTNKDKVPKWLKDRVDQIKELQRGYKALTKEEDALSDSEVNELIDEYYSWMDASIRDRRDFWAMLNEAADEMEKYDKTSADALRADVSRGMAQEKGDELKDKIKKDKESAKSGKKALEDYAKALEKFDKDWGSGDSEKVGYKVEKAIRSYNDEDKKIDAEYLDAQMKAYEAHMDNVDAIKEETDKLQELYKARKNANKNKLRETIRGLADDIMKQQLEGFDLTNWSDKTLSQMNAIKEALSTMEVPDDVREQLQGDSELLQLLINELKELAKSTITKTVDPERWKKIAKQAKYISERFLSATNALKEYAEASGNDGLAQAAEGIGRVAQNLKAAEEGAKAWGGWWGAIIGGGTDLFEQITGAFTETEKEANALKETLRSIATDSAIKQFANDIKSAGEGLFGDNAFGEMQTAIEKLREVEDEISKIRGIHHGGEIRPDILDTSGKFGGVQFTRKKETIFRLAEWWDLEKISAETGKKILDDYGNFNVELLEWIRDAGWDLTDAEKEWLDEAIETSTNYAEAMKTIESTAKNILGDVVSDLADKIVDSWWEAGEAALDYADILGDVAKAYAKLIVQDSLMKAAFGPERQDEFIDALRSGDSTRAMAVVAEAMQAAEEMLPTVQSALEAFEPYRNMSSDSSNSLGSGIQSITEETGSLLASYINAIRADVSYMRGLQEKGWTVIDTLGASLPTLNDHIAQIAATNFDIAQSNQSILTEIQSVIGAPGTSGMVVRVESA